jgi:alkylation response protein AidB-like acyl-CoA dehydrogenase
MVNRVAFDAVPAPGGYGYMREFPVERFARDYWRWTIVSGSSEIMRRSSQAAFRKRLLRTSG